tara:strand:- start:248 stop:652 length:405 start_codon:yes stop_codon:yes gene_type:complete
MNINKAKILIYIKYVSILAMSFFYIRIGIQHFIDPVDPFLYIIPPALQSIGLELVYISGYFEIVLGVLLLIPQTRKIAAYGLILLLIAVYPANLYLAFYELPQKLTGYDSFIVSWIRLPMQFMFLGIAYWHSKD